MGPTRKRDLAAATVAVAVVAYLLVIMLYRWFPPITVWTGLSLLAVGIAEAGWAFYIRSKINDGEIGDGAGRLHPLAVARSVTIAKASARIHDLRHSFASMLVSANFSLPTTTSPCRIRIRTCARSCWFPGLRWIRRPR